MNYADLDIGPEREAELRALAGTREDPYNRIRDALALLDDARRAARTPAAGSATRWAEQPAVLEKLRNIRVRAR